MERLKINIVGKNGEMGKTYSHFLEREADVIGSGRNSNISLEEAAKISDISLISVPIDALEETISRTAPYCRAIMDLSSVKVFPINLMLKYSGPDCEVTGAHLLSAGTSDLKNKKLIYCPEREGPKSLAVINIFEKFGAKKIVMSPSEHDRISNATAQCIRTRILSAYASLMIEQGKTLEEMYEISPPPTRIMLDLLARQLNPKNDAMYSAMQKHNPYFEDILEEFLEVTYKRVQPEDILRMSFGKKLKEAQERAKKYIGD